ncbi:MAG TPA: ADYC domain-containing protein, partial [Kofleriaceae bacterium]
MGRIVIFAALSLVGGCTMSEPVTESEPLTQTTDQDVISPNGTSTTGVNPQVISPNGPGTGLTLNGIAPVGRSARGEPIAIATRGAPLAGMGLVGSTWTGHKSDGAAIALRIDAASQLASLWSYRVSAWTDGAWQPLCTDDAGHPSFADSATGTWNLQQGVPGGGTYHQQSADFTLACRGSSIAKCEELGYTAWDGYGRELAACVRALRADYCGDGTPYTVNGTLVNIYDDAGLEADDTAWSIEAAWTADGAACVTSAQATRFSQVAHRTPSC